MSATRKSATPGAPEPGWMTKREVAEYARFSEKIIQEAINNPDNPTPLRAIRVPGIRIKREWVDEWLEARAAWVERQELAL